MPGPSVRTAFALQSLLPSGSAHKCRLHHHHLVLSLVRRRYLKVKPVRGAALAFWSYLPNGVLDLRSFHGGCPVVEVRTSAARNFRMVIGLARQVAISIPITSTSLAGREMDGPAVDSWGSIRQVRVGWRQLYWLSPR